MKTKLAVCVLALVLCFGFVYALLQVQHPIANQLNVGALGVKVYKWINNTAYGVEKTSHNWGMILIREARTYTSENLVIKNTGDEAIKISYAEDLPDGLGLNPIWQIEVCVYAGVTPEYVWAAINQDGTFTYKKETETFTKPLMNLQLGVCFGFRPSPNQATNIDPDLNNIKSYGNLRMALVSTVNPTYGVYSYTMTVLGTEVPN